MKNLYYAKLTATVMILIMIVAGCRSLPEPSSADDTIVVVDINRDREEGGSIFGTLKVDIAPVAAPTDVTTVSLNAGKPYETVRGLAPGQYHTVALRWEFQKSNRIVEYDAPADYFPVEPGGLTVYPYAFDYFVEDGRMRFRWTQLTPAQRRAFVQRELSEEDSLSAWRVVEY